MKKYDPYAVPARQIWTDMDLAKFVLIAFAAGIVVGWIM
jgi:Ni/Co efflux regulator RcnB